MTWITCALIHVYKYIIWKKDVDMNKPLSLVQDKIHYIQCILLMKTQSFPRCLRQPFLLIGAETEFRHLYYEQV